MNMSSFLAVGFPRLSAKLSLLLAVPLLLGPVGWVMAQTFTVLYNFDLFTEGGASSVSEALTLSGDTLYGATFDGGVNGNGVLFSVTTAGASYNVIHSFSILNNGYNTDGALPDCTLTFAGGKLYGTATAGGSLGNGVLFSANPDGTGFTTLFNFSGVTPNTGYGLHSPAGELVLSGETLYGVTIEGGSPDCGSVLGRIFAVSTNGGGTIPFTFNCDGSQGWNPRGGLVLLNNKLYGTTAGGGGGYGTMFSVNADGSGFSTLHIFTTLEGTPLAPLVLSGNTLYGTTSDGGSQGYGLIFAINLDGSGFNVLHTFDYTAGAYISSGLLVSGDTLYGSTVSGGSFGYGTIFSMKTNGTGYRVLHSFDRFPDGASPGGLVQAGSNLYGRTNSGGSHDKGTIFSLSLGSPPVITSPSTETATQGQLFVYQITATNNPTSFGATPLPAGLTFDSGSGILGGTPTDPVTTQIQLTASNSGGTGMATLTLTVQPAPSSGPVVISGTSITARTGAPFSFEVFTTGGSATARLSATGLPPGLSADPVTGLISGIPTADGSFAVTLTVTDGAVSNTFTLQLTFTSDLAIPVIISPREATLAAGQFFTYTIVAPSSNQSDHTTFSFIGTLPPGLSFDPVTGTISGTYNPPFLNEPPLFGIQLFATNSSGTTTAPLYFLPPVPGAAKNISTRLAVGTSDNVLIGGFIVTGNAPKIVIVRAIGPSLVNYGITNPLQDPTLELHDHTGAVIASNDNWMDAPNKQAIIDSGLAPSNNLESAILTTLDPGNYTAIVRGVNNTTGVALVEVYDLDTRRLDVSINAQLGNISTRGLVQTGDNVMIGGFIVRGDLPARVIVRATGPSLAQYGITDPLADPTLELHNGNGAVIAFNDNWMDAPNKQAIIDSGFAPSNNLESAILMTLDPGNYTAIVRGTNDTTGIALVEAYVLP